MSLPNFQQLMLPVMVHVTRRLDEIHLSDLEDEIARDLDLSREERARVLPNGEQRVLSSRLNWARSYLARAGLLEASRRGYCKATRRARALMAERPREIDVSILSRYPEFVSWRAQQRDGGATAIDAAANDEELIATSCERLDRELSRDIIERVQGFTPAFFERLIVDLLVKMGYGGGRAEMGRALGRSGDGGIDGVIKEDELGLDIVYVQAKRYARDRAVPVAEVRDFVGGLEGRHAAKGVFVTTSYFPASAHDFVARVSKRVILIGGEDLASLMIRHRVGVRVKDAYEIKKIDVDYFIE